MRIRGGVLSCMSCELKLTLFWTSTDFGIGRSTKDKVITRTLKGRMD